MKDHVWKSHLFHRTGFPPRLMPARTKTENKSRDRLARRPLTAHVGPWHLVQMIGEGQWTEVFQARPATQSNDEAADYTVKVLKGDYQHDPVAVQFLQREAFVAGHVLSPHVTTVLSAHVDRNPKYIVLPHLPGVTVDKALAEAGRLSTPHALWIARQVAEGLAALHTSGWLHGDIKPANVLVSETGHTTVLDLGFARRLDSRDDRGDVLTASLGYAPPETFTPDVAFSAASDVYSLGIMLFEMLTGWRPFDEEDPCELAAAHLVKPMPEPRFWQPQLSSRVSRLLRRMLAKQPLRRPQVDLLINWLVELEIESLDERVLA